ncbi:hypothetical protein J6S88_03370 [bacterium]|nr:hypothetical protein [bacterium]
MFENWSNLVKESQKLNKKNTESQKTNQESKNTEIWKSKKDLEREQSSGCVFKED